MFADLSSLLLPTQWRDPPRGQFRMDRQSVQARGLVAK